MRKSNGREKRKVVYKTQQLGRVLYMKLRTLYFISLKVGRQQD